MNMNRICLAVVMVWVFASTSLTAEAEEPSLQQATQALDRAVQFYRTEVSANGGYLWRYASDFSEREGELPTTPTTVWVQPSGTPTVGMAYLTAYQLTGNNNCLEAARETGLALVQGQLESGGWDYRIVFDEQERKQYAYRVHVNKPSTNAKKIRNVTTLDDNTTQAALSFLMRVDHALKFEEAAIHEAAIYALEKLMEAQYPNGAWAQRFSAPGNPKKFPVKKAGYPASWPPKYPKVDYRSFYTFNDNTMADMIDLMFLASEIYSDEKYREAGQRAGGFILLAQMPEPQPGWAQQYNAQMHPAWARKFEPPGVTGAESQRVMETLMRLYELTGDKTYLEPLPRALAYFRRSKLENGQLARFYELETNRPLFFTKEYVMTYSDDDLPTHYGFKATSRLDEIEATYQQLVKKDISDENRLRLFKEAKVPKQSNALSKKGTTLVKSLDERGAWVEPAYFRPRSNMPAGMPSLNSRTFATNLVTLAHYIGAMNANDSSK